MSSVNRLILIGVAGTDAELRYTPAGAAKANFRLATHWREVRPGGPKERTDWHEVVVDGMDGYGYTDPAKRASTIVRKGSIIYIEGRLSYRKAYDHANAPLRAVVVATRVELLQQPKETEPT